MFKFWSYNPTKRSYVGAFETVDHLPSGFYSLNVTPYQEPVATVLDPRQDELQCFRNGPMQAVIDEIVGFWKNASHYKQLGVTHKRGILLHGPAGCGKTSLVAATVKDTIKRKGIAVSVTDIGNFAAAMPLLRQIENGRPILAIIEDIEHICQYDEEELLEVMDGASTLGDGLLFLCTTNNLPKLPVRIRCRPSRIDTLIEIGLPNEQLRAEYLDFLLAKMCPENHAELAKDWAKKTRLFSLAQLKELVISVLIYEKDVTASITRLKELGQKKKGHDDE